MYRYVLEAFFSSHEPKEQYTLKKSSLLKRTRIEVSSTCTPHPLAHQIRRKYMGGICGCVYVRLQNPADAFLKQTREHQFINPWSEILFIVLE